MLVIMSSCSDVELILYNEIYFPTYKKIFVYEIYFPRLIFNCFKVSGMFHVGIHCKLCCL